MSRRDLVCLLKSIMIAFMAAMVSAGCTGLRGSSVTPSVRSGRLECAIRYGNANGIIGATLTDRETDVHIWRLIHGAGYFTNKTWDCGEVTPDMRDRPLSLLVSWQYDEIVAASAVRRQYLFRITKDDKVIDLKEEQ